MKLNLLLLVLCASCARGQGTLEELDKAPAFPGAEGFGKYASGGRGGTVIVVTNLNDSGPGSLRDAVKKKGPRIITFAVSGTIVLQSNLTINNDDVTIAGQTAPGDGICLRDYQVGISANNVIVRYMRFRLGDEAKVQGDSFGGTRNKNIIVDHCSISWATDECASFYYNQDFTMQWCLISESLNASVHEKGDHGYGGIWGGVNASFHHNLLAHHTSRLPRFSGSSTTPNVPEELVDFRNNVIYNWQHNNTYGGERGRYNVVNNYYKAGPATVRNRRNQLINPSEPYGKFYLAGNYLLGDADVIRDNRLGVNAKQPEQALVSSPFSVVEIPGQSATEAYNVVLASVGASLRRDAVDQRVIREVAEGVATLGKMKDGIIDSQKDAGGWPELKTEAAPVDTDQDGMPDEWERSNGLDALDKADGSAHKLSKTYTNVEVYINSLIK